MTEHTIDVRVDCSNLDPFIAKMGQLIDCVRDVFGEAASLDFELDADVTITERGELELRPFCKSLEVRR